MLSDFTLLLVNSKEDCRTNAGVLAPLCLYLVQALLGAYPLISACLMAVGGWSSLLKLHARIYIS